jgi:Dolichyl-phosphate-mannose-protein mannosyltransferase
MTSGSSTKTTCASCGSSEARATWLGLPAWVWLLLAAALTGSYCIGVPFSAGFREAQTAMITRNLWRDGWSGLLLPRIDWLGNSPGYMLLEFPLYNAAVAVLYAILGPHDVLGRIVSLACSLGALALFYGIVRRLDGERTALLAAALMALTPLQQSIGQSVLPEPMLMLCLLASLYAMVRYAEGGPGGWLAMASVMAALATLVKSPPGLMLLGPLLYLAWTRFGWSALRGPSLWLAAALALGIYYVWQRHADHVNAQFYPYFVSTAPSQVLWNFGPVAMRWDWHFYARIAGRLLVYVSPMILLAALPSLCKRPTHPRAWLWHVWLAANTAYVLLCANLHFRHKHYQIVFVPIAAALAARAVIAWWPRRRRVLTAAAALLLMYDAWMGWQLWREQRDPLAERACAVLREMSAPQDLVVVAVFDGAGGRTANHHNNPAWLYLADRRGWNAPLYAQFNAAAVEQYRQQGARWLALKLSMEQDETASHASSATVWHRLGILSGMAEKAPSPPDARLAQLAKELAGRYRAAQPVGDAVVIFDLRGP